MKLYLQSLCLFAYLLITTGEAIGLPNTLLRRTSIVDVNNFTRLNLVGMVDQAPLYITELCLPANSTNYPDLSAPCNVLQYVTYYNCSYGYTNLTKIVEDGLNWFYNPEEVSATLQQACYCDETYWEYVAGCNACYNLHCSSADNCTGVPEQYLSAESSSYCSSPATVAFDEFLVSFTPSPTVNTYAPTSTAGNRTDVNLYFTPSATITLPPQTYAVGPGASGLVPYPGPPDPTPTTTGSTGTFRAAPRAFLWAGMIGFVVWWS
ncbi:hypothetical protein MMC27_000079 [Xylographa pallens]|nr:hypothetical protein [Xylographa pallens]